MKKLVAKWAYAGADKAFFEQYADRINVMNDKVLSKTSLAILAFLGFAGIYVRFSPVLSVIKSYYTLFFMITGVFCIVNKLAENGKAVPRGFFCCLFAGILYSLGVLAGFIRGPVPACFMLSVLLMVVPLLFIIPPVYTVVIAAGFSMLYFGAARVLRPELLHGLEIWNIVAGNILGGAISYIMNSVRIQNIKSLISLEQSVHMDEITGLFNRQDFNQHIEAVFSVKKNNSCSLMMMDVDDFRAYNDTYGHIYGDLCLEKIGAVLAGFMKKHGCYIARFGGEEFVLMDCEHNVLELEAMAEELIREISLLNIENIHSPYKKVTMSIGISSIQYSRVDSCVELINLADDALFQAKQNGKNTLVTARHSLYGIRQTCN